MHDFKTILCPTDFSEESYHAVEYGLRFAKWADGTLLIPHIIHMPSGELYQPDGHVLTFDAAKERAATMLKEFHESRLGSYPKCELMVAIGDPFEQLMAIARDRPVDLIVTATHGRTGLEQLIIGSVAEKLIRHAQCPLFVLRRGVD